MTHAQVAINFAFAMIVLVSMILLVPLVFMVGWATTIYDLLWAVFLVLSMTVWGITMLLGVAGVVWAPFASRTAGRMAKERGLSVPYYRAIGTLYSVHLLFPWLIFMSNLSSGEPIRKMPIWTYAIPYGLWLCGPIALSTAIAIGFTWEHTVGGDYSPGEACKVAVWRFLIIQVPVMLVAWTVSLVGTVHNRYTEGEEVERVFPRRNTKAVIASAVGIPIAFGSSLIVGMGLPTVEHNLAVMLTVGAPGAVIAGLWFSLVGGVHRRGEYRGLVASPECLLPTNYLSPFMYSFMWCQWVLWTGLTAWSVYGARVDSGVC